LKEFKVPQDRWDEFLNMEEELNEEVE